MSQLNLLLYFVVICVNIIVNSYFYLGSRKNKIYFYGLVFWSSTLINFITQGFFEKSPKLMGLSMLILFFQSLSTVKIYSLLLKIDTKKYDKINYFVLGIGSFFSLYLSLISSFTVFTSLVVLTSTFPLFYFITKEYHQIFYGNYKKIYKILFFIFIINQIHILDYPFLRMNPEFSQYGFFIAFSLMVLFSLSLVFLSDAVYISSIEDRLRSILSERAKDYKENISSEIIRSYSHDLNNALQPIQFVPALLSRLTTEENEKQIKIIENTIKKSILKIEELTSLMKSGQIDRFKRSFSLLKNIEPAISMVPYELNIQKDFDASSEIVSIEGVCTKIFTNIFSNFKKDSTIKLFLDNNSLLFVFEESSLLGDDFNLSELLCQQLNHKFIKEKDFIKITF